MNKILAIDYGKKRIGLAETDSSQIFAFGLETVETEKIFDYLKNYFTKNVIDILVIGLPKRMNNIESDIEQDIKIFILKIEKLYPNLEIIRVDERFTSKMAFNTMLEGGLKKQQRRDKSMVDKIAATIILQSYLDYAQKSRY